MANKLSSDDLSGGTITLSNIGAIGGKFGSPLINVPEVAIIALGRIQTVARFDEDDEVYSAPIMTVSTLKLRHFVLFCFQGVSNVVRCNQVNVGADHRVLDGATVAKFCNEWKSFIEKPGLMTLHMK